ncbi:hypothetical protein BGZ46_007605 [Entomortierella lignicola]|nr:hypothetical protein BGZ46_007605 [Entomortierella lignicola]
MVMDTYNTQQLAWNSAHTINREGRYCYCGHDRRLDELSLQCKEVPLGPVVPFITNYKFLCKVCVLKPTGRSQQNQEPREPGSVPEFFERVTAGWKEICATTIANLIIQEYLKEAKNYQVSPPSKKPNEENMWSVNADYMDWNEYRYYFNKKDHILPYVDRYWKALCTDRSRTPTWWATLGSCLYISKDVFAATDEQARSASSDFCLVKSNLWNMKPGHITSHQSSSSKSQLPRTPREGKRKSNAVSGIQDDAGGSKKTSSGKSEKKSKNSTAASNRRPATPPVIPQTTYIPLPNTVVPTKSGDTLAPFSTSNEHPYNRHRFKYVTCESDPLLQYMLYRQTANPVLSGVRLSREDMSPYMMIDEECMTITTEKGFRMARANCGVREGKWFYEVTVDRGGEPRYEGRDGAHVRLGWARREGEFSQSLCAPTELNYLNTDIAFAATLQAPVGFDAYSYGIRDTTGEKVHMSRVTPYGEPFKTGDVIGLYISLPPDGNEKSFFKHRRLRRPFYFKGQLYFESVDYSPTKRYIEMAEYEATPVKTNLEKPTPPSIIPGSKIIIYKNGVCQGVMWQDLFALLPIEQNAKEKDQLTFDDGTQGYYPVISVYRNGKATANFGPDFKYPPSADPEAEAENRPITEDHNVWQPMSYRWEEKLIEESLIDLVDEVEVWASEQAAMEHGVQSGASKTGGDISSLLGDHDTPQDYDYDDSEMSSSGRRDPSHAPRKDRSLTGEDNDDDVDMDSGAEPYRQRDSGAVHGDMDEEESDRHRSHRRRDDQYSVSDDEHLQEMEIMERDDEMSSHDVSHYKQRFGQSREDEIEDDAAEHEDDGEGSEVAYYDRQ